MKRRKRPYRILLLLVAGIMLFSGFGEVLQVYAASSVSGSGDGYSLEEYKKTDNLEEADKKDSTQKNYQESDLEGYNYSTSLLQSAEWTDKTTGAAKLNIHYEAEFGTTETATRSLYVFTACTYHSFTEKIAIINIIDLLNYNEYVDVIMIGTTNSIKDSTIWNITAASMFSLKASDFTDYDDGVEDDNFDTKGNYIGTATNTKAAMIAKVLETYLNSSDDCTETSDCDSGCTENNFADIDYAYGLGSTDDDSTGYVDVLYDESIGVEYPNASFYEGANGFTYGYKSAAEIALTFGGARHAGVYFSLYYIAEYIDIIESNYGFGSFESTVEAIFNSFDAFNTAYQNSISIVYVPEDLYEAIETYIGLDMTNSSMSLSDMQSSANGLKCWGALSVLQDYSSDGRYIALVPDNSDSGGDSYHFSEYAATGNYGINVTEAETKNMLLFALTLMAPSIADDYNESKVQSVISDWMTNKTTVTFDDLREYNENIYVYSKQLSEISVLKNTYTTTNTVTITTTITSEFEITDTSAIAVTNSGDNKSYFYYDDPKVTSNADGSTTVSIEFYNLSEDNAWAIDISIPVSLKANVTNFCTDQDWFKDINIGNTTAKAMQKFSASNNTIDETATVASPKLYKYETDNTTTTTTDTVETGNTTTTTTDTVETGNITTTTTDTVENPKTSDNILLYFVLGAISLIGLISAGIYFRKYMKNKTR